MLGKQWESIIAWVRIYAGSYTDCELAWTVLLRTPSTDISRIWKDLPDISCCILPVTLSLTSLTPTLHRPITSPVGVPVGCKILGSQGGEYVDICILCCNALRTCRLIPTFRLISTQSHLQPWKLRQYVCFTETLASAIGTKVCISETLVSTLKLRLEPVFFSQISEYTFRAEDINSMFLRNVGIYRQVRTALQPRTRGIYSRMSAKFSIYSVMKCECAKLTIDLPPWSEDIKRYQSLC
jgi:hypothetical protein